MWHNRVSPRIYVYIYEQEECDNKYFLFSPEPFLHKREIRKNSPTFSLFFLPDIFISGWSNLIYQVLLTFPTYIARSRKSWLAPLIRYYNWIRNRPKKNPRVFRYLIRCSLKLVLISPSNWRSFCDDAMSELYLKLSLISRQLQRTVSNFLLLLCKKKIPFNEGSNLQDRVLHDVSLALMFRCIYKRNTYLRTIYVIENDNLNGCWGENLQRRPH